jgi:hypothetical protein
MSKATGNCNFQFQCLREEDVNGHTWFDITNGLLSIGNFTAREGFRIALANVFRLWLRWNVSLHYTRVNSKVRRFLSDCLARAGRVLLNWGDVSWVELEV